MISRILRGAVLPAATAAVLSVSLLAGASSPASAQSRPSNALPRDLHADLQAAVDSGATSALAVVRQADGRTVRAGAGPQRIDRPGGVDPTGTFRAGSVTKSFLATVVLQLVDGRRVNLEDPISCYVRGIPGGDRITVHMLLNHTSGLPDYTDTLPLNPPSGFLAIRYRHWTPDELLARALRQPMQFEPGTDYGYSDTNYLLLGKLVQRVTGLTPAQQIERRILGPLQLRDTYVPTTTNLRDKHAHAYLPDADGNRVDITRFDPSVLEYSGSIVSSGADLNRFFAALTHGWLLSRSSTRLMSTVQPPAREYGLGLRTLPLTCDATALGHDGDVPGASTWSYTVASTGRSITVSMTWGTARPKQPVLHLIDDALCGRTGSGG